MKNRLKLQLLLVLAVFVATAFVLWRYPLNLGLDLQGGTQLIFEAEDTPKVSVDHDAILGVLSVIRNRIDALGVTEPTIRAKGQRQIEVELPGVKDPDRAISIIGQTALMEFVQAEWAPGDVSSLTPEKLALLAGENARLDKVIERNEKGQVISEKPIILKETALTGADLKSATPGTNQYGEPIVNIEFTTEGAKKFRDVTTGWVGKPLAIVLDGHIISAPNINEPIAGGRAQISGHFSVQEMRDLVIKLKAGALPVPVKVLSNKVVGPTLGKDSIDKSIRAGIAAFVVVAIFMVLFYQLPGVVAAIALVAYVLITLACLKLLHATLTLPGIAGFILTIGMAVDADVIIFERIKEEKQTGVPMLTAIENGFNRAFITILDSNISTLIAAAVLFWLGSGTVKGFAVTLSIGVIVSMFTAITLTKLMLEMIARFALPKDGILFRT
ncbi:MAG: protein translocase subunit SecD [Candidatus Margulisiibacteriota bacterium]